MSIAFKKIILITNISKQKNSHFPIFKKIMSNSFSSREITQEILSPDAANIRTEPKFGSVPGEQPKGLRFCKNDGPYDKRERH